MYVPGNSRKPIQASSGFAGGYILILVLGYDFANNNLKRLQSRLFFFQSDQS